MLCIPPDRVRTRDVLRTIPIVQSRNHYRSPLYAGIQHGFLADTIIQELAAQGFTILAEKWATSIDEADVYGYVDLSIPGEGLPFDGTYSLGIRSSNVSRFALTFLAGARISLRSNGMCTGEHIMRKRHYISLNLQAAIHDAVIDYRNHMRDVTNLTMFLRTSPITDIQASHYMMELARRDFVPWNAVRHIDAEYRVPSHEEFRSPDKWSLYNACTHVFKTLAMGVQIDALAGLRTVLTEGEWDRE